MTKLQNNLMSSFLQSLKQGQKAVAENGRVLTYQGMSSDGHSFLFDIEGIAGRKVYSLQGIGHALPSNFTIDLSSSLGLTGKEIEVETATKKKSDGVPKMWIAVLIQNGILKPFSMLEVQGDEESRAIFKGISSRGLPIFSVHKRASITGEFTFSGDRCFKNKAPLTASSLTRLKVPANYFSVKHEDLFKGVKPGDIFTDFSGNRVFIEKVNANGSFSGHVEGYARRYNANGISLNGNLAHTLISHLPAPFQLPIVKRRQSIIEVAPGIFKRGVVTKKYIIDKILNAENTPAPKLSGNSFGIPTLQSITAFLAGAKEKFLVVSQEGEVLKDFTSESDAQFETTSAANAAPGTKVQLVKVQVLGYSEVPKPVAVFNPV